MVAHELDRADDALDIAARLAAAAGRERAELLVLPECTYPAYWLESAQHYRALKRLTTAQVVDRLGRIAREHRLHLVCGLVEESGERLYNAAAVIDPAGGLVGMARKTFLWDCDNRWFTPGDCISVFETALGRIGVQICADARAPETTATLVAKGAELVAMPTAWVDVSGAARELYNIQPEFLIESRAREFAVPFVCADKAGPEGPMRYVGQSMVVTAEGRVLRRAAKEGEELVVAEVMVAPGKRAHVDDNKRRALLKGAVPLIEQVRTRIAAARSASRNNVVAFRVGRHRFETAHARAGYVSAHGIMSFVRTRCLALDGVQAICVPDAPDDLPMLRTRAAENRVFVLAESEQRAIIIGPEGRIRADGDSIPGVSMAVDVAEADIKEFTPETNLWGQRRTECFEF